MSGFSFGAAYINSSSHANSTVVSICVLNKTLYVLQDPMTAENFEVLLGTLCPPEQLQGMSHIRFVLSQSRFASRAEKILP